MRSNLQTAVGTAGHVDSDCCHGEAPSGREDGSAATVVASDGSDALASLLDASAEAHAFHAANAAADRTSLEAAGPAWAGPVRMPVVLPSVLVEWGVARARRQATRAARRNRLR